MVGDLASAHASAVYLVLRCASIVPIVISGTLIVGLAAAGNRQLGVLVLVVVNAIHIPLLLMLGLGWWTHHPFGIVGAGVSSLLSETIAATYAIVYVARRPHYRVFADRSVPLALARRCAMLGLPEAIFLLGVLAPDIFIVAMLAPLGAIAVAAFRALNVVSDLTFVVPGPLQYATQIMIGQRLGARDPAGARLVFRTRASRLLVRRHDAHRRRHCAAGMAAGVRIHARRERRDHRRAAVGVSHGDAAAQRMGDDLTRADPRVGRHKLLDDRRNSVQRAGHSIGLGRHRATASRIV